VIGRRVQAFQCRASTCVEFEPEDFQQMAGLMAFYDITTHYYLRISRDEELGKSLNVLAMDKGVYDEPFARGVSIEGWWRVYLRVTFRTETLQFSYSRDGEQWTDLGGALDATRLSDDYCNGFTGAFVALACHDVSGRRRHADFDWFAYEETDAPVP
jgi:xylan 1,4-beta-xylosidase